MKGVIRWYDAEEKFVGCRKRLGLSRTYVYEKSGSVEGLGPERGRHEGLKKKSANEVISGTNGSLSFAILLGGIGTGETEKNTVLNAKGVNFCVFKLTDIVALDGEDW